MILAVRIAVILICCIAIWWSARLTAADRLFRQDTPQSIRAALRLAPGEPRYYLRLAQLDDANAVELLEEALRLAPFDSAAAIELGLHAEAEGDYPRAETLLTHAFDVDRTYVPRWTLAGFYFRHDRQPQFWTWARRAAEMPAVDISALFELCWRIAPDGERIARALLTGDPSTARQFLAFLIAKNELPAAAHLAPQLIRQGDPSLDRALLLNLVDRLIVSDDFDGSTSLWRALMANRWIEADRTLVNNSSFARTPLPAAFDWRLTATGGVQASPGLNGVEVEFSGKQGERRTIAEQTVALDAGDYKLRFRYRTSGIPRGSGVRWSISVKSTGRLLSTSPHLSSEGFTQEEVPFRVPAGRSLVRLLCDYNRMIGTTHIAGILVLKSVGIERLSTHELPTMQ